MEEDNFESVKSSSSNKNSPNIASYEEISNNYNKNVLEEEKIQSDSENNMYENEEEGGKEKLNQTEVGIEKKQRKKRRKKNEIDGRNFLCNLCDKAYFSYPALINHKKMKHNPDQAPEEDKRRSRFKKQNEKAQYFEEYQEKIKTFFDHKQRGDNIIISPKEEVNNFFKNLDIESKYLKNFNDHREVLDMIIFSEETETDLQNSSKSKTIDEAIISFLKNCVYKTSFEYLNRLVEYCLLFRECVNFVKENNEYTSTGPSRMIPELANDFVKFLAEKNYFEMNEENFDSSYKRMDIIDFLQFFCYWCLSNKFTKTKISLIN
jgi:hypothetical protein